MSPCRCYSEKAPEVDELLDTLSHPIRREVIYYFEHFATDNTASMDDLAAHIEGQASSVDGSELREGLHHAHLPKLTERGWLDYDTRSNDIRYYGHDDAAEFLSQLADVFSA